ncbi:hypothetical protein D3C86_1548980 [compost metagenome]
MTKKPELQRELILEAWQSCDNFFVGLQLSCDPTTVIPVTKIPEIDFDDGSESEFTFSDFITLYDKVTQVGVDPAEAREFIIEAAMVADFTEWNTFYRRILLKKLQEDLPMDVITKVLAELTGLQKVL